MALPGSARAGQQRATPVHLSQELPATPQLLIHAWHSNDFRYRWFEALHAQGVATCSFLSNLPGPSGHAVGLTLGEADGTPFMRYQQRWVEQSDALPVCHFTAQIADDHPSKIHGRILLDRTTTGTRVTYEALWTTTTGPLTKLSTSLVAAIEAEVQSPHLIPSADLAPLDPPTREAIPG